MTFHLLASRSSTLLEKLRRDEIDIGLIVDDGEIALDDAIEFRTIYRDIFSLYSRNPDTSQIPSTFISFPGSLSKSNVSKVSEIAGTFSNSIEVENLETLLALVEEGAGVGLLPFYVARQSIQSGRIAPFTIPRRLHSLATFSPHSIGIVRNINAATTPGKQFVTQELERYIRDWVVS